MISSSSVSRYLRYVSHLNNPRNPRYLQLHRSLRRNPIKKPLSISQIPIRPFTLISTMDQTRAVANGGLSSSARRSTLSNGGDNSNSRRMMNFELSQSNFLRIQKGDITEWSVDGSSDAIVS